MKTVGVLALQGAFIEHITHLQRADPLIKCIEVRTPEELDTCDALVIPGGESTLISLIAERTGLLEPLKTYIRSENPVWGTCAGLIFLAKRVTNGRPGQKLLGGMDITVQRNAFGRQLDSFEQELDFSSFINNLHAFPAVFIRAPVVQTVLSNSESVASGQAIIMSDNNYTNPANVEILHQLENGFIVAVRQGTKLGTSFHPELAEDSLFHKWFLDEFVKPHA